MRPSLLQTLKQLRLSGLAQSLEVRLSEASGNRLDHAEFLELILQDELNVRSSRLVSRRVKSAMFGEVKNLDEFDFSFNPSIKRKQIHDLTAASSSAIKPMFCCWALPALAKPSWFKPLGTKPSRPDSWSCIALSLTWPETSSAMKTSVISTKR